MTLFPRQLRNFFALIFAAAAVGYSLALLTRFVLAHCGINQAKLSAILSAPLPADVLCALVLAVFAALIWLTDREHRARMTPAERREEEQSRWLDHW